MLHHFILTRFNIRLWSQDKNGKQIDSNKWLEQRLQLFETYTLPSVIGQTCQDFTWILLADSKTPTDYRERMKGYRQLCPQINFISVNSQYGNQFARIFQEVVNKSLKSKEVTKGDICLTTYLDNDDTLHKNYIQETHDIVQGIDNREIAGNFITFDYGLQYYTELGIATCIKYPNNHFMTFKILPKCNYTYNKHKEAHNAHYYRFHIIISPLQKIIPATPAHFLHFDLPVRA